METLKKQKAEEFKNKVRMQLKPIIQHTKEGHSSRKSTSSDEGYDANFFLELDSGRRSSNTKTFENVFEQLQKLGEGAQSVVKKVMEKSTKRVYAVKVFNKTDAEMIMRIKQVYLLLRKLNFPTITKPSYLFISNKTNTARVIMDYITYPTLECLIKTHGHFDQLIACTIIKVLLETVAYLHSQRVCHRDIKPANILYNLNNIDEESGFRLIDYEICKHSNKGEIEMWTTTGTLFYKAPEMFKGSYNEKIDIWACGIIAYQLLHGRPPFVHEFINETIQQITSDSIEDKLNPDIDPFAKQFIRRCLNKNPQQRLSASEALKQPFILKADRSPITPRNEHKLNSSFELESKVQIPIKRSPSISSKTHLSFSQAYESIINDELWY